MSEIWKAVPGFEGAYEVSNLGRVWSLNRTVYALNRWGDVAPRRYVGCEIAVRPNLARGGYNYVMLNRDGRQISRRVAVLVAAAFIGPRPEGLQVCHEDGVNTRDHASNLYYGTPAQNTADKVRHGTIPCGETHGSAVLTEAEVHHIKSCATSNAKLAAKYGVHPGHIANIRRGLRWSHV